MFQAYQVPARATLKVQQPAGWRKGIRWRWCRNWAGTGRDLAVVSNGKWTTGFYQADRYVRPRVGQSTERGGPDAGGGDDGDHQTRGLVVGTVTQQSSATVSAGQRDQSEPDGGEQRCGRLGGEPGGGARVRRP